MKNLGAELGRYVREKKFLASPPRAVIGLEAEFNLFVDGKRRRPEKVFGDPSRLVRRRMTPRTGKSFQLPAGGAIYFDTGVIEVATPIVELERDSRAWTLGSNVVYFPGSTQKVELQADLATVAVGNVHGDFDHIAFGG